MEISKKEGNFTKEIKKIDTHINFCGNVLLETIYPYFSSNESL